jgi:hypothetical protein
MDRCPNCRARTDAEPSCRRCGMDLSLLQRVERAADAALLEAVVLLADCDPAAARDAAGRALALRRTDLAERIAGFLLRVGNGPDQPEPGSRPDDTIPA